MWKDYPKGKLRCLSPDLASEMARESSDFVLDEGLDDDEDILAFHSSRHLGEDDHADDDNLVPLDEPSPAPQFAPTSVPPHTSTPRTDSIIIDGMPLTASRADLNQFLSICDGKIISLQLRPLEASRVRRVRVKFEHEEAAAAALRLDGQVFVKSDATVSVKPFSEERWNDGFRPASNVSAVDTTLVTQPKSFLQMLPDTNAVKSGFWSAFSAARSAAERLEERATELGEQLEHKLHLSEKVADTRDRLADVDQKLHVSETVGEIATAGKSTVQGIDETYGISTQVGKVVGEVGSAARTVASEVDESFQLSERAREATNMALRHNSVGPAVRAVVDNLGGNETESPTPSDSARKKNYQPSGTEQDVAQTQTAEFGE